MVPGNFSVMQFWKDAVSDHLLQLAGYTLGPSCGGFLLLLTAESQQRKCEQEQDEWTARQAGPIIPLHG